jgi:hypothetical protein
MRTNTAQMYRNRGKGKGKFVTVRAMKAYSEGGGIEF